MGLFGSVFGEAHHLTVGQECARGVLLFAFGLLLVRVAGRRIFGKWSALDIVVSIMIGSSLSRALTGSAPLLGTMAAAMVIVLLHAVLAALLARWPALAHIVEGRAKLIAERGQIDHAVRRRHGVSHADLEESLRKNGVGSIDRTRQVTLEPSGAITVLK